MEYLNRVWGIQVRYRDDVAISMSNFLVTRYGGMG